MIPSPHLLHVVRRVSGGSDAMGNPVESWGEPESWMVHGWHVGPSPEAVRQGREPSSVAVTVYARDAPFTGVDRVVVAGESFEVIGDPADWTHGPWRNPVAGFVVELKRKEG